MDEDQNRLSDEELNALVSNHEEVDLLLPCLIPPKLSKNR